jgi:hypothetical protein
MELLVFAIFAVIFAMAHNYFMPRFAAKVATYPKFAAYQNSYAGQTAVTAVFVFILLVVLGYALSMSGEKAAVGRASIA